MSVRATTSCAWARLACTCLITLLSGTANAHFPKIAKPGTDVWVLITSSSGRCNEGSLGIDGFPPCTISYPTADAACTAGAAKLPLVTEITVFPPSGTFPNQLVGCRYAFGNPQDGCFGTPTFHGCTVGWSALELGELVCPDNSHPIADGLCHCNSGFLEPDGTCSGGDNNGPPCPSCGNPANIANGNKFERQVLYRGLNGFELTLAFNTFDDFQTRFGRRWRDSFNRRISVNGGSVFAFRPDGKTFQFTPASGGWTSDADTNHRLTELQNPSGVRIGWELYAAEGDETENYDALGNLLSIRSKIGLTQTLSYSDGTTGSNGGFILDTSGQATATALPANLLIRATDRFGRTIAFGYDSASRVVRVSDPAGGAYRFAYGTNGNLASITFPDDAVRTYVYNEPENTSGANLRNALTGIVDENGARFATFQYDPQEKVVSTEHADGAQRYTLSYANATTVNDPLGTSRSYGFNLLLDAFKNTGISGPACPSCGSSSQTFDSNGNTATRTDWNGNLVSYSYDLARNLETSRTEAFGTPQARTITTAWHSLLRLPARIAGPLRIITYAYSVDSGRICGVRTDGTPVPGVVCAKTVEPTSDTSGARGFQAAAAGPSRTWSYAYNENGSVLTADGPRTDVGDVTKYAYYPNDDGDLGKRGNIATITNALGHATSITAYNAHGQPLTIVDPNGLATNLAYDARQRLISRDVGGESTRYTYDRVGQLTRVTLPDGSDLSYIYDPAHRLTGMRDSFGDTVTYTLDAMGNRTKEDVFDPSSALAQTRSRVFNNLNRLVQELGSQSQTTQYAYDDQGNAISITDPLNHATSNQYDALNRLIKVTDPNLGQTQYAYDGADQLVSVTDPRNLATLYSYDGLSNLMSQQSPDTGTTANTYDTAGNLLTQIDAKSQATTRTYDALNRVTSTTFADRSIQVYGYDGGTNGIGRLTSITEVDAGGQVVSSIAYVYDQRGRTTSETRAINGVSYVLAYAYDAFGRLAGMTYPSGRTVVYGFDPLGRISQVATTPPGGTEQVVASNITYQPFGGVKSYTLGNGQAYTRSFDLDGRITGYTLGAQAFSIGYDTASRIRSISDTSGAAPGNKYSYDSLDRLIGAALPNNAFAYDYDAVGNRTSKTVGSSTDTYVYSSTSNRISSITSATGAERGFAFDANGSTISDGTNQYVYDARGRMVQSTGSLGQTSYQINALGERIRKTSATDDRVFIYDTWGHLIAEASPGGAFKREYLYLNDIPLAVIQ